MELNYWAILVAGLMPMVIGSLWFGPLFGKQWLRLMEKTEAEIREEAQGKALQMYGVTFIFALLTSYVLAHILGLYKGAFGEMSWALGMQGAFWCWLGFFATVSYQGVVFEGRKLGLYFQNAAYNLVTFLAMGAILGAWQ